MKYTIIFTSLVGMTAMSSAAVIPPTLIDLPDVPLTLGPVIPPAHTTSSVTNKSTPTTVATVSAPTFGSPKMTKVSRDLPASATLVARLGMPIPEVGRITFDAPERGKIGFHHKGKKETVHAELRFNAAWPAKVKTALGRFLKVADKVRAVLTAQKGSPNK
ncbi:hypothetical protein B0O99DRAFT_719172 [Bisporella sp. PMI_857]|nr:hypothetical protein B0O99DRAFT_719172 [Bisporella sp. PMI_857]